MIYIAFKILFSQIRDLNLSLLTNYQHFSFENVSVPYHILYSVNQTFTLHKDIIITKYFKPG